LTDSIINDEEQRFIQKLIDSPDKTLNINFGMQGIVYVNHEKLIHEKGFDYFEEFLHGLEKKGYLKKTDKVYNIFCPKCNFPSVYSRYSCPTCHSTHMDKIHLIQHPFCGYIGQKSQFQEESGLQCPKCKTDITEQQASPEIIDKSTYKTIGFSFECDNKHKSVSPDITHLCPSCQAKFNHRESNYRAIYNYVLTKKAYNLNGQEIDNDMAIAEVQKILEQLGYVTAKNDPIVGFSSGTHVFSLTGKKNSKVLLFDIAPLGGIDELTKLLGKKMDIENSTAVFLDTKGNKEIVSLGQVYGINVVDLTDGNWLNYLNIWLTDIAAVGQKKRLLNRLR